MKRNIYYSIILLLLSANTIAITNSITEVGSIPGQFNVGASGAASYTIPIDCPAGINGIQPSMSLNYSSNSGNGTVGIGWSVAGLSSISRTGKNLFSDKAVSPISYDNNDQFTYDGDKLLLVSGTYGADGSTYQTEHESFNTITAHTSTPTGKCPDYFTLVTKDGKTIEYGNATYNAQFIPTNETKPMNWMINKVTDTNGNYMTFTYQRSTGGQTVISQIDYTGNGTNAPYASLKFNYKNKDVTYDRIILGQYYSTDILLLQNIQVFTGTTLNRQYDITYINNSVNDYFLKTVNLTLQNGNKVSSTRFNWGATETSINNLKTNRYNITNLSDIVNSQCSMGIDLDGDGKTELVRVFSTNRYGGMPTIEIYKYTKNGLELFQNYPLAQLLGNSTQEVMARLIFADLDGNGSKEIYYASIVDAPRDGYRRIIQGSHIQVKLNNVDPTKQNDVYTYTTLGEWDPSWDINYEPNIPVHTAGDINNDGKDEIISIERKDIGTQRIHIFYPALANQEKLALLHEEIPTTLYSMNDVSYISLEDVNHDGLLDLCMNGKSEFQAFKNNGSSIASDQYLKCTFGKACGSNYVSAIDGAYFTGNFSGSNSKEFLKTDDVNTQEWYIEDINNNMVGGPFKLEFASASEISDSISSLYKSSLKNYYEIIRKETTFYKPKVIVFDYNADGHDDIILIRPGKRFYKDPANPSTLFNGYLEISWWKYNGKDFGTKPEKKFVQSVDMRLHAPKDDQLENLEMFNFFAMGDFDGNGHTDLFSLGYNLYTNDVNSRICQKEVCLSPNNCTYEDCLCANENYYYNIYGQLDNIYPDHLKINTITDATFINSTSISYQSIMQTTTSDNKAFYSKDADATFPIRDIIAPFTCVQKVTTPDGIGGTHNTTYSYGGLKAHVAGAGGLGFKTMTVSNDVANASTTSTTEMDYSLLMPTKATQQVKLNKDNTVISSSERNYSASRSASNVYVSRLASEKQTNPVTGTYSQTVYDLTKYDEYANPQSVVSTTGAPTELRTETKAITYIAKGSTCKNKVESIISTTTSAADVVNPAYVRTQDFSYDTKGNLTTQTNDKNVADAVVTTTYGGYDKFGHATTITVSGAGTGAGTRTSSMAYTPSGRFIQSKTDALGRTTTYDWDEAAGTLKSQTDFKNRITSYTYNGIGQQTSVTTPAGHTTTTTTDWVGMDPVRRPQGMVFYTQTIAPMSAPVCTWYDQLGRPMVVETRGLKATDRPIYVYTEYRADGKPSRTSDPTFESDKANAVWSTVYDSYDDYGRCTSITTPLGTTSTAYDDAHRTTTVTSPSGTQSTTLNTCGQTLTSTVNGKSVSYTYYPSGQVASTTPEGGNAISMKYNLQGLRTEIKDPDAGTTTNSYNSYGELYQEINPKGIQTIYTIEPTTGLITQRDRKNITTASTETSYYRYDPVSKGRLYEKVICAKDKIAYTYDYMDRVLTQTETVGAYPYTHSYQYDAYGRIYKETYPSGYYVINTFDDYSNLIEIKDSKNHPIWKIGDRDAKGQISNYYQGSKLTTNMSYDALGRTTRINTPGVADWNYTFDPTTGNMSSRTDSEINERESFLYDSMNRLTTWNLYHLSNGATTTQSPIQTHSMSYYPTTGNINTKTDIGTNFVLKYNDAYNATTAPAPPHAISSMVGLSVPNGVPTEALQVGYTDFNKLSRLSNGTFKDQYRITYGVDDQRITSEYSNVCTPTKSKIYVGNYEIENIISGTGAGTTRKIHYLSGAMWIQTSNTATGALVSEKLYYTHTDFQGSLTALTNEDGTIAERYAYNPWGARRCPTDWTQPDTRTSLITDRGYTGHEHIDLFRVINMNGRVYDPTTAQFLSPDPMLQAPGDWLNYNRYTYCMNNPLKYTDPSGYYYGEYEPFDLRDPDYQALQQECAGKSEGYIAEMTSRYAFLGSMAYKDAHRGQGNVYWYGGFDEYSKTMDNYMRYGFGNYNLDGSPVSISEYLENQHKTDFYEQNYHNYYSKNEVEEARKNQNENLKRFLNGMSSSINISSDVITLIQFANGVGNTYGKGNIVISGIGLFVETGAAYLGDEQANANLLNDAAFSILMYVAWSAAPEACFVLTLTYQIYQQAQGIQNVQNMIPVPKPIRIDVPVKPFQLPSLQQDNIPTIKLPQVIVTPRYYYEPPNKPMYFTNPNR
jgi:RHS repeat-associated protein